MIKINEKKDCMGCHGCYNICPKSCITMESDNEGFWYPKVDEDKCIECGLCERVCPIINPIKETDYKITAFACKNKDKEVRKLSSSGGVFSLLCNYVISKNGVVFGAAFDNEFYVRHMYAETLEDCEKFRGSKYVQSKIGDTYIKIREFLNKGRLVLFSGTPCQASGLESFLMKKYENLIIVDTACHGVPSPFVYKNYIKQLEEKSKSNISSLSFRDKSTGWSKYSIKVDFNNGMSFKERGLDNIYMSGFLKDIYLRPSCYDCNFKKPVTSADITLADYWGIQDIHPDFDDDKGVSLILVNSKKGKLLFDAISKNMEFTETDFQHAIKYNPCIIKPVKYNPNREKFFKKIEYKNLENIINKYTKVSIRKRIKNRVKRFINNI